VTYVEVHGLRTWHEVTGAGQPVVLLHGAFAGAASWSGQTPVLAAAGYKVHVPERRGHAHTPDVEGPLTYEVMADDTVAYLDGVVGGPAHLVGWSDGAVVALLVARRRPELVDRLVLIGQYYNSSGKVTGGLVDQLSAGGDQAMGFLRAEAARGPSRHPRAAPGEPRRGQRAAPVVPRRSGPGRRLARPQTWSLTPAPTPVHWATFTMGGRDHLGWLRRRS
jgi:pimeloyl-ACP methyl ester carboxylesterase